MAERPVTAFILSLIGGIFVFVGGLALGAVGTLIAFESSIAGFLLWLFPLFGLVIIIGAALFNSYPRSAKAWGIVILILGILSLIGIVTALGGILSVIGGALAIRWRPRTRPTPPPPLGQQGLVRVTALKEKLLLSFGILCILIGAIGVSAAGVGYYNTDRALNKLPSDIERLFSVTNQTTDDVHYALHKIGNTLGDAAFEIDITIFGDKPLEDTAASMRDAAISIHMVAEDVGMVSGYLEESRNILLDEISSIRLTAQITFGYIGVLHALFIIIGVSILRIRKSLLGVIDSNKT